MVYFCFPSLSETPQQDLPVKFLSALFSVCDDEGRYLHHLLQVHLCAGSPAVVNSTVSFAGLDDL